MLSPFEELEWVAEFLPEEGQSVVITRESGQLVCQAHAQVDLRDGIDDAELYGRLVQMNEQLVHQNVLPLWLAGAAVFWTTILVYGLFSVPVQHWYLAPGMGFLALSAAQCWSRGRRDNHFQRVIRPVLERTMMRHRLKPHALLGGISHHSELKTLHSELIHWMPERSLEF
ncbi:MAG TPA: hypothetical protein VNQ76_16980 [Planctomicrobium sp.]|nr:hypothetical protein [Planctomicrobium sp.]